MLSSGTPSPDSSETKLCRSSRGAQSLAFSPAAATTVRKLRRALCGETYILLHAYPESVKDGYLNVDHIADDRTGFVTLGMEAFTETGIIGKPSLASAIKGKAVLESLTASPGTRT